MADEKRDVSPVASPPGAGALRSPAASPPNAGTLRSPAASPPSRSVLRSLLRSLASPPGLLRSPAASPPLASLVRSLARSDFRDAFARDPEGTLKKSSFDTSKLPAAQLSVLRGLSADELEVLARVVSRLREANNGRPVSI